MSHICHVLYHRPEGVKAVARPSANVYRLFVAVDKYELQHVLQIQMFALLQAQYDELDAMSDPARKSSGDAEWDAAVYRLGVAHVLNNAKLFHHRATKELIQNFTTPMSEFFDLEGSNSPPASALQTLRTRRAAGQAEVSKGLLGLATPTCRFGCENVHSSFAQYLADEVGIQRSAGSFHLDDDWAADGRNLCISHVIATLRRPDSFETLTRRYPDNALATTCAHSVSRKVVTKHDVLRFAQRLEEMYQGA